MTKKLLILSFLLGQIISYSQTKADDLRQIVSAKAYNDGTIQWTAVGESSKLPYVIEQFRWKKWIKIGEVDGLGTSGQNTYSFKAIPFNGENLCRVKPIFGSNDFKEVKWTTEMPNVNFSVNKNFSKIEFSDNQSRPIETMYEIIDSSGTLVKKGWAQYVSIDNLPKGKYTLNYENKTAEFNKS